MSFEETLNWSEWTKEQDKAFENCLALYAGEPDDRWEKIAAALTGKTREEIRHHYDLLVEDLNAIESGCVPLPCYTDSAAEDTKNEDNPAVSEKDNQPAQTQPGKVQSDSAHAKKASRVELERRKGIAWTPDEHRKFLKGLEKFGKGDWRSISRHYVRSRTPTQVASHAQKYFNRLNSGTKQRRRTSIHDITCDDVGETSAPQGPITGEKFGASASGSSAITEKLTPPIPPTIHVNDGDTSNPVGSFTGHMNQASAAIPLSTSGMPSPSIGCPVVGAHTELNLPSSVQAVYGFNEQLPGVMPTQSSTSVASSTNLMFHSSDQGVLIHFSS